LANGVTSSSVRRIAVVTGAVAAVLTAISASVILMVGPEWIWSLFGPPDLGPVTFETLERRATPNDALASSTFL
jgi:hypothetical protein